MSDTFTAIFDACVLYPFGLRDLLVQLATTDRFRGRWSPHIHEEWINAIAKDGKIERAKLEHIRDLMNEAVLDSVVTGYEDLIPSILLPDENDRHVVAAAIRCGAQVIVTKNQKHFPSESIAKYGLQTQHPDEFVECVFELSETIVCLAAKACRARLKSPALSVEEYLCLLEKQDLFRTVACLRPFSEML